MPTPAQTSHRSTKKPVIANEVKQSRADQWETACRKKTRLAKTFLTVSVAAHAMDKFVMVETKGGYQACW